MKRVSIAQSILEGRNVMQGSIIQETGNEKDLRERLASFRKVMGESHIDLALVRSTDDYLNEYVPANESRRVYITGFAGSVGDALISKSKALLFVDGRYAIQAKREAPCFDTQVAVLGASIEQGWLNALENLVAETRTTNKDGKSVRLAIEAERIPLSLYRVLENRAKALGIELVSDLPTALVEQVRAKLEAPITQKGSSKKKTLPLPVPETLSGKSTKSKLLEAAPLLERAGLDAFFLVALDDIAWLANHRGKDFPYSATFKARALALKDKLYINLDGDTKLTAQSGNLVFATHDEMLAALKSAAKERAPRVGIDATTTPFAIREALRAQGADVIEAPNPYQHAKSIKNPTELLHMRESFARADNVVYKMQRWINRCVASGEHITEADVATRGRKEFMRSGAQELSFTPICGAGPNGAVIHYGTPDAHTPLKAGELFLLDTGALYEGGYATDLTRTFLLGGKNVKATDEQRTYFTLVLKGAIAGMCARFPKGTGGMQLDAIVRDPMWRAGLNFPHGTGHGVGINVHEFPPRISPAANVLLEVGQVFSIEPGLYLEGELGIRIENLCTLVEDKERIGFLRVLPLTFAPLDKRLIDAKMLTPAEKKFLDYYAKGFLFDSTTLPALPPI
jgi:Xaa-Pro aminopeptidase